MRPDALDDCSLPELRDLERVRSALTWIPDYDQIPAEYVSTRHPYQRLVMRWRHKGLPAETFFHPRVGVDGVAAIKALKRLLEDSDVRDGYKYAAAACLVDCWFESVSNWEET